MREVQIPAILTAIINALTSLLDMVGEILGNLFESGGAFEALLPIIGISIAASVIFLAVKIVKKISWGY